jgi:hypothetical protein
MVLDRETQHLSSDVVLLVVQAREAARSPPHASTIYA